MSAMRLTTRLLLLLLACLLLTLTLGVWVSLDQRAERRERLSDLMSRQVGLVSGDVDSIALGTRDLLATVAIVGSVRLLDPACGNRLAEAERQLPKYAFLAVLDRRGRLICSSAPNLMFAPEPVPVPTWAAQAAAATGFATGQFADPPGVDTEVLPFFLPLIGSDGERRGTLVAGLDLNWLAGHLRDLNAVSLPGDSVIIVADRNGVVLARSPRHGDFVGKRLPSSVLKLVNAAASGAAPIEGLDGAEHLVGYMPAARSGSGVAIALESAAPDLMTDSDRESLRDVLLLVASALVASVLCLLAARRFFGRASTQLVAAARRWHAGDMRVRVEMPDTSSEFGQIAAAWNEMAAALERREAELRDQAQTLEANVAERTGALSETNNRLQVEIAERQQTEASLVQAQKLQTVGELAGGIAHDFNNLLATILGSLDLIGRDLAPDQDRQRMMIARASEAVGRGAALSGRLLAFSRRKPLAVRATDVNKLIADLGALLATSTLGRRIALDMRLAPTLWPAMAEPSQVEAAILNLALNARDAMSHGGVLTISTATETRTAPPGPDGLAPGEYVAITLRDTGEGMSEAVARRAFEPFFSTKGSAGSGLGLSQVMNLCREAGGTVRLETAPDVGTAVTLLLPRARVAPAAPRPDTGRRSRRRWNVLLVDDDESVRQVTADMLAELGCQVRQAGDGQEALGILGNDADRPELLVADYAMPGMNGLALAAEARLRGFAGPVLLATGYAEDTGPEAGDATPDAVLHKPFTTDELGRVLSRLAGARRSRALHPADA